MGTLLRLYNTDWGRFGFDLPEFESAIFLKEHSLRHRRVDCIVSTDKEFLMNFLLQLSDMEECCFFKISDKQRDSMYLARCFFTTDDVVGRQWRRLRSHPKLICSIQEDEFVKFYRK